MTIFLRLIYLMDYGRERSSRGGGANHNTKSVRARPSALAKSLLRPEVAEQLDAGRGLAAVGVGRREDDCDHVVAVGGVAEPEEASVGAGGACDLPLLAQVYVRLGRGEPVGAAGLDLDEAEHGAVVGDEVDLVLHDRAPAVAADARLEVRRHQLEALRAQVVR